MPYRKVTISSTPAWDFYASDTIEGIYRSHKENVGPNNSRMYDIELESGEVVPANKLAHPPVADPQRR